MLGAGIPESGCRNRSKIDGNASGPDNRGADPGVGSWTALTDATGQARVTVTVSMQPGNNYRAGASVIQSAINGTTQVEADANTPPANVVFTDMLTVWRKVWLELDSMAAGSDITYTGVIDEINNNSPHAGDGTVELDVPDINDNGRFEGGTMTVPATGSVYTIIDNIDRFVDDDYTMSTLIAAGDLGATATVVDDDTAVLPKTPDANITVLNDKYRNCYVAFTENSATRDNNNTFIATLENSSTTVRDVGMENADLLPATDFWVARVVTCYQPHHTTAGPFGLPNRSDVDGDPDAVYHVHAGSSSSGETSLILGWTPNITSFTENVCVILLETMLDAVAQSGPPGIGFMEPYLVAHEIGHQFGLPDVPSGSGTLMQPYDGADYDFDATEIDGIRSDDRLASD